MSSSIQQLQVTQSTNYWAAAATAAVLYDQVLMFGQEIDFIWNRQWSLMTILYFIARYCGSLSMVATAAWVLRIDWTLMVRIDIYLVTNWTANIFVLAMQVILLLRAYALCQRSNIVLALLLTCYCSLALTVWILSGLCYNLPVMRKFVLSLEPAIGSVQQIVTVDPSVFRDFQLDITIIFVSFDILVLLVALYAFFTHVVEAHRTHSGWWSANSLIKIILADQILYFLCFVSWMVISLAADFTASGSYDVYEALTNVLNILNALSVITGPRMVIRLRAHEVHSRGDETELGGEELQTIRFIGRSIKDDATLT
ncbi:hypothetical protein BJ138DRAFT_1182293 [Hygrophoropsis aurantiaca]|uniref:Uncharacterized protein n=1 Tax=Hygrophoropsis aurantiaca TaxID=72124 RepID=A0ACB8A284_9AGAM|nr:hypothetical protein BJ138DRAFT_1182293 [Hygrophoropsis aurantiaca]